MSDWLSADVLVNGLRLHYYRTGGARPPVVLAHGATDDGLCWTALARVLESDYDVIMPDARGHGLSAAPTEGYDAATQAADLAGLIQALDLERPVVIGHSMGARTALYLAADYPDLVRGVGLEDPPFWHPNAQPDEAERAARLARLRQAATESRQLDRATLIARCREQNPAWSMAEVEPWAAAKQRVSPQFLAALGAPEPTPWWEVLPRVRCPLLLITGDPERGAIVTPETAAEAVRRQPRLQVVRIAGAGHSVRRDRFGPYLEAIRSFLATV